MPLPERIAFEFALDSDARLRLDFRQRDSTDRATGVARESRLIGIVVVHLKCHDIRPDVAGVLVGQRVELVRQQAFIQMIPNRPEPAIVDVMENPRCHFRPIVDRHTRTPLLVAVFYPTA